MRLTYTAIMLSTLAAPAMAKVPDVVADFPITASLVQQVLGDLGGVHTIMGAGSDPHNYQMRPSDARALESANLLVWIGPELTPWLGRASENLGEGSSLSLLHTDGTEVRSYPEEYDHEDEDSGHKQADKNAYQQDAHKEDGHDGEAHGHDDHGKEKHGSEEHGSEEHGSEEHGHDEHDHHDGADPHAWLNPANARHWLGVIAHELADLDPENAETYNANAQQASDRIAVIEQDISAALKDAQEKRFVVFHDAYGYFTEHFGLQPAIAVSLGDASSPSAARIAEIREEIMEAGASCAFPEFAHDVTLIDNAIEGHQVKMGDELDPAGRQVEEGAELYEKTLENLGKTFADCLGASGN